MKNLQENANLVQGTGNEQGDQNKTSESIQLFDHQELYERQFNPFQTTHGAEGGSLLMMDVHH